MPDNNIISPLLDAGGCDNFVPKAALVVFAKSGYNPEAFIELREIRRDGSMSAARPVSKEFVQNVLSSFSQEYRSVPHGLMPSNLLYCDTRRGHETYVWYNPPCRRNRFFSESLGMEDDVYHVPGTLYAVQDGRLSVFCFTGRKPSPDKTLLGVPYFNVYADGRVCMGSAHPNIPDKESLSYGDVLAAWENAFWNSVDVHTNGSPSTRENILETIRKYKDKPFDTKELVVRTDGLTLNKLLKQIK